MADDITLSVEVTPSGGGGSTELHDPANGFRVRGWGPGVLEWRHRETESDFTDGRLRVNSVKDEKTGLLIVWVEASTIATWKTRVDALLALFDDEGYQVDITVDATLLHQWQLCGPATIESADGGQWEHVRFMGGGTQARQQSFTVEIPHSPVTAAGLAI